MPRLKQVEVTLHSEDYLVKASSEKEMVDAWGDIDPRDKKYPRYLRYRSSLSPRDLMYVLLHEALHVQNWSASEKRIEDVAHELRDLLWKMGYRLVIEPCEE